MTTFDEKTISKNYSELASILKRVMQEIVHRNVIAKADLNSATLSITLNDVQDCVITYTPSNLTTNASGMNYSSSYKLIVVDYDDEEAQYISSVRLGNTPCYSSFLISPEFISEAKNLDDAVNTGKDYGRCLALLNYITDFNPAEKFDRIETEEECE